LLATALTYNSHDSLDQPFVRDHDLVQIQFKPGVLQARLVENGV